MDQLDYRPNSITVVRLAATGPTELPELKIVSSNLKLLASKITFEWLHLLRDLATARDASVEMALIEAGNVANDDPSEEALSKMRQLVLQSNSLGMLQQYLLLRGQVLLSAGQTQDAVRILEAAKMVPDLPRKIETMLAIDVALGKCYETMGEARKCALLCEQFKALTHLLPAPLDVIPGGSEEEFSIESWEFDLFGAKNSREMACKTSPDLTVVTKRPAKRGELIYIDKPVVGYVEDSQGQCSYCTFKTLYTVPCYRCRAVFYCSVHCFEKDAHYHRYECTGYRVLFFPLVFGILEIRMLVQALDILVVYFKRDPKPASPRTAQEMWSALLEGRAAFADFFHVLVGFEMNYNRLDLKMHQVLLHKARTLLHYVQYARQIDEDYGAVSVQLNRREWNLFLWSLLLRFSLLTMFKSSTYSYTLAYAPTGGSTADTLRRPLTTGAVQHAYDEKVQLYVTTQDIDDAEVQLISNPRDRGHLETFWNTCINMAEGTNSNKCAKDIVLYALRLFAESYFTLFEHTEHLRQYGVSSNRYYGMYRSIMELQPSGQTPNVSSVFYSHGAVGIHAFQPIASGQTLAMARRSSIRFTKISQQTCIAAKCALREQQQSSSGTMDTASIRSTMRLINDILCVVEQTYDPQSIQKCKEILFVVDQIVGIFNGFNCETLEICTILNMLYKVYNLCVQCLPIAEVWMEEELLASLFRSRTLLRQAMRICMARLSERF